MENLTELLSNIYDTAWDNVFFPREKLKNNKKKTKKIKCLYLPEIGTTLEFLNIGIRVSCKLFPVRYFQWMPERYLCAVLKDYLISTFDKLPLSRKITYLLSPGISIWEIEDSEEIYLQAWYNSYSVRPLKIGLNMEEFKSMSLNDFNVSLNSIVARLEYTDKLEENLPLDFNGVEIPLSKTQLYSKAGSYEFLVAGQRLKTNLCFFRDFEPGKIFITDMEGHYIRGEELRNLASKFLKLFMGDII